VLGDPTRVVLLQLHLAIRAPTRGYLSIQQCTSSNGEKGSKNEKASHQYTYHVLIQGALQHLREICRRRALPRAIQTVGRFSDISKYRQTVILNNNYTYASGSQSLVLRHTSQPVPSTRDMYKSNHTYHRRTFLSSLLKSFLRILLKIWRGISRDPKYKAISEMYKYVPTDRISQYREPQVSLIPDR